jgi:hypothetical protein
MAVWLKPVWFAAKDQQGNVVGWVFGEDAVDDVGGCCLSVARPESGLQLGETLCDLIEVRAGVWRTRWASLDEAVGEDT